MGGIRFDEDMPAGDGGNLLQQRKELAGLDIRADAIAVGLPVKGVGGPGGSTRQERDDQPKQESGPAERDRTAEDCPAPGTQVDEVRSNTLRSGPKPPLDYIQHAR